MSEDLKQGVSNFGKNLWDVILIVGWVVMHTFVVMCLVELNPEIWIENWQIGLFWFTIFAIIYALPIDMLLFSFKKLHKLLMLFWLSWVIADYEDFLAFLAELFTYLSVA